MKGSTSPQGPGIKTKTRSKTMTKTNTHILSLAGALFASLNAFSFALVTSPLTILSA